MMGGGVENPLDLIVEIKGKKNEQVKLKKATISEKWVPGVNALGIYGRWNFAQFEDIFEIKHRFDECIEHLIETFRHGEGV